MSTPPGSYQPPDGGGSLWSGFSFRPGDIVISTPRKTGTTWVQMICALLIFQTPELPDRLINLSPWLDNPAAPPGFVDSQLREQRHRRFIKTHTPLDGIPRDPQATYIVTARHPLDAFVSLCRHKEMRRPPEPEHTGDPPPLRPPGPPRAPMPRETPPMSPGMLHDALLRWIAGDTDESVPGSASESLPAFMWHLSDAWARRGQPNVLLVHYDDLVADLAGQMRRLAGRLGIAITEPAWPALVQAATFEHMRGRAEKLVPTPAGSPADSAAFFRRGTSGAGRELLSGEEMTRYYSSAARLAPPDLLEWLHSPSSLTS